MIETVHIVNFKGHRDTRLQLKPFTVLVGPNASGKTSVLDAILVLRTATSGFAQNADAAAGWLYEHTRRGANTPAVVAATGRLPDRRPWSEQVEGRPPGADVQPAATVPVRGQPERAVTARPENEDLRSVVLYKILPERVAAASRGDRDDRPEGHPAHRADPHRPHEGEPEPP